ncbi:hypothetical protein [Brevundimonas sp. DC300-4]|uniref:AbiTii domain-containing protein n=1 Tax=Brevundimonas sp. DC300-4 TaxID=2804594 RepID=UPI003CEC4AB6
MTGLVEELQREALDPNVPVTQLLRKAKVVAVKLKLDMVSDWLDAELNGYEDASTVPEYRVQPGHAKWFNSVHGWLPIEGPSSTMDKLSYRKIQQPISSLEEYARRSDSEWYVPFSQEMIKAMFGKQPYPPSQAGVFLDISRFVEIVDRVRGKVLDWALDLERAGITGEGLSFSTVEQQKASHVTIKIEQMHGNLLSGDVSGPNARANFGSTDNSTNQIVHGDVFGDLRAAIESGVSGDEKAPLLAAVADMKAKQGGSGFVDAYQKFITSAANHMQLVAPFLPALTTFVAAAQ